MKVLLVTTSYPASDEDPSGHFVRAEARQLARAGHDVHVIAPCASTSTWSERDAVTPSLLMHHVRGSSLFGWPGVTERVKTNPFRLVHALPFAMSVRKQIDMIGPVDRAIGHWMIPCGVPLLLKHPAPLVVVAHGADVRLLCALPRSVRCSIVQALVDRATRFRFVAGASLQTLRNALPSHLAARLEEASYVEPAVIELPDVTTRANELRASNAADTRGFVVVVGRFIELKRFDLAIASAASAKMPIVLVGDGPERERLEQVASKMRVQATFTGRLSRTETLAWIAAARVLVHVSRAEAAPTVVREARALDVPVVATASGDLAAWARTDSGIVLVDPEAEAIAAGIVSIVKGSTKRDKAPSDTVESIRG